MKTILTCLALVAVPFNDAVIARCTTPQPPCEALAGSTIVALVDVIEAAPPWEITRRNESRPVPQAVKLRIMETFKAVSSREREISIRISHESAESIFLDGGKRYLLYARQGKDGTHSTSCTRTKLADIARAELSRLRQCIRK